MQDDDRLALAVDFVVDAQAFAGFGMAASGGLGRLHGGSSSVLQGLGLRGTRREHSKRNAERGGAEEVR